MIILICLTGIGIAYVTTLSSSREPLISSLQTENKPNVIVDFGRDALVGHWQCQVDEFERDIKVIDIVFKENGTHYYTFYDKDGRTDENYNYNGTWVYHNNQLIENFSMGLPGIGTIKWINKDYIIVKIEDNTDKRYTNIERHYTKVNF